MVTGYHLSLNICENKKQDDQICAVMSFSNVYGPPRTSVVFNNI